MKSRKILFTPNAADDLRDIYQFISSNDSVEAGKYVYRKLKEYCLELGTFPSKGKIPPELEKISVTRYRQILCKPYRIIFRFNKENVFIMAILDGRRNLQDILIKRLLG